MHKAKTIQIQKQKQGRCKHNDKAKGKHPRQGGGKIQRQDTKVTSKRVGITLRHGKTKSTGHTSKTQTKVVHILNFCGEG